MKRFLSLALVGALVLGVSSVVYANVCAFDPVPAATLLFPFVAYDYQGGNDGTTTLFSITNVSSEAQIVHVTLWTDFSVAILDFNILLTGYDVQEINIRDILGNGQLPVTVIGPHTDDEGVSDDGPVSSGNNLVVGRDYSYVGNLMDPPEPTNAIDSARCNSGMTAYPGRYDDPIDPQYLALFEAWLKKSQTETRQFSDECYPVGGPYGSPYNVDPASWFEARTADDVTWMYITADVVETCNLLFPSESAYWVPFDPNDPGAGVARYDNVLIGQTMWIDNANRFSEADNAVHLEADLDLDNVATLGNDPWPISFYARYSNPLRSDWREPLPTAWAFRYLHGDLNGDGIEDIETSIRAWKGSTMDEFDYIIDLYFSPRTQSPSSFIASNCYAYTYYSWDDDENVTEVDQIPWSQPGGGRVIPNLLPLETQEVSLDWFNTIDVKGWMLFVWPASNFDVAGSQELTPDYYQTWMGVKYNAFNMYSAATSAVVMANYNCFSDQVLPDLGVNYKYVDPLDGYYVSPGAFPID